MTLPQNILDWLLEEDNPSVCYRTLTELLGCSRGDPPVERAREAILTSPPVLKIFARMHPDGFWLHKGKGAGVSYATPSSTHFILSHLAELGLDREEPRLARAVERYLSLSEPDRPNPQIWEIPPETRNHQSCLYAFNLRTFLRLGYRDDPRVQERVRVLLEDWRHDGGYLCDRPSFKPNTKSCIRGALKALSAFALLLETWQSERCQALVDYFLRRRVFYRTDRPGEVVRGELVSLLFPFDYRGSLLEPLLALGRMGYGRHPALADAWSALAARRDVEGKYPLDWKPTTHFDPGPRSRPNKWTTFYAYLALKECCAIC
jgi:hypothetical protein